MTGGPLEHLHAHRGVRPRVPDHARLQGGQLAVRRHSRPSTPSRIGWRLGWSRNDSSRESVHFTGLSQQPGGQRRLGLVGHVLLAAEGAAVGNLLDDDPLGGDLEHRGDLVAVVPDALAAREDLQGTVRLPGTARVDSGSRKACSTRWVWKTSWTVWAEAASARLDVAPAVGRAGQHVAVELPDGVLGIVDRRHHVGQRAQRPIADIRRAVAAARAASRESATTIARTSPR